MFKTFDNDFNVYFVLRQNKELLSPISLHDIILSKYALILGYYPMKKSKFDILSKLNKNEKLGMLNSYILGVASKIGIYQSILKDIISLRTSYKVCKRNLKKPSLYLDKDFWSKSFETTQLELSKKYNLLLDVIIEEITRRNDPKYLRKKKLKEIKLNLQN